MAVKQFPFERGPHLICPNCHVITDLSQNKPPGVDEVNPIDLKPPAFVMASEDKGIGGSISAKEYDPEGDTEDKYLKSIGATLISKRIHV